MNLETIGRDCLFLNWALPADVLPELEAPLRYDQHGWRGGSYVFLSAALFRQQVLDLPRVRFPKLTYPQLSLRLCTLDGDGMPSFYLCSVLLPAWVLPSARWVSRKQARKAAFSYPRRGADLGEAALRWTVKSRAVLDVRACAGLAAPGEGPSLGSWQQAVTYFQRRERWYFSSGDGLRRLKVRSREIQATPVAAEVVDDSLLGACLGEQPEAAWPALHSAWFSPEIPFVFEMGQAKKSALPRRVPAPG